MFNKKLILELIKVGVLDGDGTYNYRVMRSLEELDKCRNVINYHGPNIVRLRDDVREVNNKINALMELLGVTFEQAHKEPAKLVKGKKEVRVGK